MKPLISYFELQNLLNEIASTRPPNCNALFYKEHISESTTRIPTYRRGQTTSLTKRKTTYVVNLASVLVDAGYAPVVFAPFVQHRGWISFDLSNTETLSQYLATLNASQATLSVAEHERIRASLSTHVNNLLSYAKADDPAVVRLLSSLVMQGHCAPEQLDAIEAKTSNLFLHLRIAEQRASTGTSEAAPAAHSAPTAAVATVAPAPGESIIEHAHPAAPTGSLRDRELRPENLDLVNEWLVARTGTTVPPRRSLNPPVRSPLPPPSQKPLSQTVSLSGGAASSLDLQPSSATVRGEGSPEPSPRPTEPPKLPRRASFAFHAPAAAAADAKQTYPAYTVGSKRSRDVFDFVGSDDSDDSDEVIHRPAKRSRGSSQG